jgi:hypothetical protein
MQVWSDLGEPRKAESALVDLLNRSKAGSAPSQDTGSDASLIPNSESFALVIRGWLKIADKGDKDALMAAVKWLDSVRSREQQSFGQSALTQVDMYSGILASSRKCASRYPDILDVAVDVFDELRRSHHQVDCLHYSRLLQVGLLALSRPENDGVRSEFLAQIVAECAEDGLVSKQFIQALANGPVYPEGWTASESRRTVNELVMPPERGPQPWPLPSSWTRNVKQSGLHPDCRDVERSRFELSQHGVDPYNY